MSDVPTGHRAGPVTGPGRYEIRVQGHLAARWAAWFDGMTLTPQDDGTSLIHGAVTDQAALHGLFRKLSDIGVPIVSVARIDEPPADPADQHARRSTT